MLLISQHPLAVGPLVCYELGGDGGHLEHCLVFGCVRATLTLPECPSPLAVFLDQPCNDALTQGMRAPHQDALSAGRSCVRATAAAPLPTPTCPSSAVGLLVVHFHSPAQARPSWMDRNYGPLKTAASVGRPQANKVRTTPWSFVRADSPLKP